MERRCLAGAVVMAVVTALVATTPAAATFAGTNGRLVFSRDGNIFTIDPDGTHQVRLTNTGVDWWPTWSPDGTSIAFVRGKDCTKSAIWVTGADGTYATRVSARGGVQPPIWSADGTAIAYSVIEDPRAAHRAIFVATPDGQIRHRLTGYRFANSVVGWSPDSKKLLFHSDRDGDVELWTMDRDGTGVTQLTHNTVMDLWGSYSPDGTHIVFSRASRSAHRTAIWVMDGDGTHQRQLTSVRGFDDSPAWSPDGTWIAFRRGARTSDGMGARVYRISPTGSDLRVLTPSRWLALLFTWSPDSTELLFQASDRSNPDAVVGIELISSDGWAPETVLSGFTGLPDWQALP